MQKKSILMPHACHKIGWWLLFLIPLVVGFYEILYYFFRETPLFAVINNNSRFMTMISYLVLIASAFFICLSKEKVEDEMVSQYRLRAIGISAYVNFILYWVFRLVYALQIGFQFGIGGPGEIDFHETMELFDDLIPFTTAGLYYLVFKWMLWRSRKEEAL
ncbi:MAG: hypothetical protein J6P75_09635 [Bacteroidales bacterium]|nr:hypothetical protein [Bacteroidales bacterium]